MSKLHPKDFIQEVDGLSFPMRYIEGGSFDMGSNKREREKPIHEVIISSFYLASYLVTQELYKAVMGQNPSHFKGSNRPVEKVSWHDAEGFCKKLKEKTGKHFRLPTEAEWEYAARGGTKSEGFEYSASDHLKQVGWYGENSGNETKAVGVLLPNELGLYDMSGNVYEWCEDWYSKDYYKNSPKENPKGPDKGNYRVIRRGDFFDHAFYCRTAYRNDDHPGISYDYIGFRVALSPPV